MSSSLLSVAPPDLDALIDQHGLSPHFQPIVDLHTAALFGHEALIRGPADSALAMPADLFAAARDANLVTALEFECVRAALLGWSAQAAAGKLFVNLSASALASALSGSRLESSMAFLEGCGVPSSALVIELTEHERVDDLAGLQGVVELLRLRRVQLALDDFGDGRSSLRLWSELRPDYVKIDRYFTHGLAEDPNKLQTFRAMLQIAETFGSRLVAEGVESEAELRVLRDLDVHYAQGWYLGRPQPEPLQITPPDARRVLRGRDVAVLPELGTIGGRSIRALHLLVSAPGVAAKTTNDEIFDLFARHPHLHAVAVVKNEHPRALIDRQQFLNQYARPFYREVFGRRSCLESANSQPICVDLHADIEELMVLMTADDHRYLREGVIVTEHGRYCGLVTGQALVKAVAEARIEVARHSNPLTFLPGNIPTSRHIERLLASGGGFTVAHADLNDFKPFNDHFGYWRGDEMIRLAAAVLASQCDAKRDFLGHIGGDDFVVVFQSEDWSVRCRQMVLRFNERALELLDPQARLAGGILSIDRHGEQRFHPCTSLSMGVVCVSAGQSPLAEQISAVAAAAKRTAKHASLGCYVEYIPAMSEQGAVKAL